jgi:hypothetical protein
LGGSSVSGEDICTNANALTTIGALLGDVAKFTLYFTKILSELGQIHYMKSW